MAKIVLGLGTSHSPHVSTTPDLWYLHEERDNRNPQLDMPALRLTAPSGIEAELTPEVYQAKHDACQAAIDQLAKAIEDARADVVVVVGDDERELFRDECMPAFAVYAGKELYDLPLDPKKIDPSHKPAMWARHSPVREKYPLEPRLAEHIVRGLIADKIDVAIATTQYPERSIGHAFTFVRLRLLKERMIPMVPVFINTYFPPNQPTPDRCFEFGRALRSAIESWESDARIAVVASGGLSHFVIDEEMDRQVLRGIAEKRSDLLVSLPLEKLNSGNSEIRNWVAVAAAVEDYDVASVDYTPAYRSLSGTGCGMAFVRWEPPATLAS